MKLKPIVMGNNRLWRMTTAIFDYNYLDQDRILYLRSISST
jgi:hypothetical protein